ncbi:unnamed protein product [Moneuplotes crassus]|uniref:Uncharacterized protein n=1 Tax=Euplotes crassus TaxID=5936 RepID=A0AAD1Y6M0_EUPCR|nr:unnamed protein product [Moneuplotes crassus]
MRIDLSFMYFFRSEIELLALFSQTLFSEGPASSKKAPSCSRDLLDILKVWSDTTKKLMDFDTEYEISPFSFLILLISSFFLGCDLEWGR